MRIEGVICDLDGTIVDSEGVHMLAWNELLRRNGHTPPDDHWHEECIGLPDVVARDKAIRCFPDLAPKRDQIVGMKESIFREMAATKGRELAYPGVHDCFAALERLGVRLAVGTNSIRLNCETSLKASGLTGFFPVVVTIDQVAEGKPAPDIYLAAAARLGLAPERCAVLEDSPAGLAAARAAGCFGVGVENTWKADRLTPSDRIFSDTASALDWVLDEVKAWSRGAIEKAIS